MKQLLIPILILLICCSSRTDESVNCYFPVKNFMTEQTYCFINKNDTTEKYYWKMVTSVLNTDTFFKTKIYNSQGRITEMMTEKIRKGNSTIASYVLYDYD